VTWQNDKIIQLSDLDPKRIDGGAVRSTAPGAEPVASPYIKAGDLVRVER
jgi:hypothetical protein